MNRLTHSALSLFALLVGLLLVRGSAQAGDVAAALKLVPEDALGFAVIPDIGKANAKIEKGIKLLAIPFAEPPLKMLDREFGEDNGVDETGTLLAVMLPPNKDEKFGGPEFVFYIPVTDYKKFEAKVKASGKAEKDPDEKEIPEFTPGVMPAGMKHALLVPPHQKKILKRFEMAGKDISAQFDRLKATIAGNDGTIVVTQAGVKLAMTEGRKGFEQLKEVLPKDDPRAAQAKMGFDVYIKAFTAIEREVDLAAMGISLTEDMSLAMQLKAMLNPAESWSKTLGKVEPRLDATLAGLPMRPFMIAGKVQYEADWFKSWAGIYMNMFKGMLPADKVTDADLRKYVDSMFGGMEEMKSMSMLFSVPKEGESIYAGMAMVLEVNNTKSYFDSAEKSYQAMKDLAERVKVKELPVTITEIKRGTLAGMNSLEFKMQIPTEFPGDPSSAKMMEMLFGKEKTMNSVLVAVNDTTVIGTFGSAADLTEAIAAFKAKASAPMDGELARTMSLLPKKAHAYGYLDVSEYMRLITRVIKSAIPPGIESPKIPSLPELPPIGSAIVLSGEAITIDVALHVDFFLGLKAYFEKMSGGLEDPGL